MNMCATGLRYVYLHLENQMNTVLHTNGTPGFQHNSATNVRRVMNALSDRYFTVKAMSVNRGTNKGKDAVPNGEGGRITYIPVLCVCPKGSKNAFEAKVVRPAGKDSYVGFGVGNGNTQGFDCHHKAISAGNERLRAQTERKWARLSDEQRDTLNSLADLRVALAKLESALGPDDDMCTPLRQKIEQASKTVDRMSG